MQSFVKDTFFFWGDGRSEEGDLKIDLATPLALLPLPVSAPPTMLPSGLLVVLAGNRGVRCRELLRSLQGSRAGNGDGMGPKVGSGGAEVIERVLSSPRRLGGGVDPGGASCPAGGKAEAWRIPSKFSLGKGGGRPIATSGADAAGSMSRTTAAIGAGGGRSASVPAGRVAAALDVGWCCCRTALGRRDC